MAENQQALGAEIMKEVTRYNDGMGCTRRQLVDNILILISQSRLSPASAAPVVDKDLNPPKNAAFEVWWKGQIARDFVHAALTELEKVSGPKLVAGESSFAVEATAISAARRSLDSALSTLDGAKSMVDTAARSQPPQCVRCKHYAETDPRGRCISVYYDAAGSLVYCGCKCEFRAAATAAPVEHSGESQYVVIDGEHRRVIPCPDGKPDCEVLHTEPITNEGAR